METTIMELAARQHGVVARRQLLGAGVSANALDRRLRGQWLRRLHRGVYLVGPLPAPRTREMAAVLACGDEALVGHDSALDLWDLMAELDRSGPVHVGIPRSDRRRHGIRVHRMYDLRPDEITQIERIPVTTPGRTLLDVARTLGTRDLERALAQAYVRRLTHPADLQRLLLRHSRLPGASRLRALIESGPPFTRSEAEERFLALVRKAQLPLPEANVRVGGYEVDFYWRAQRFVAEIDGFAYHSSTGRFESDRRRDAVLAARGVRVVRVTWRQIKAEAEAVIARLAQSLVRAGHS
jgi:very-short-patch-repair endonuclease